MSDPFANLQVVDPVTVPGTHSIVRTAEDLEPALPVPVPVPVADADADTPEPSVVDAARPFPIVLVGTQEDVAGAGCASGVGLWPWNQVEVP